MRRSGRGEAAAVLVQAREQSRSRELALALLLGLLVFALLFATRAAEQTRDSLVYALSAKTGVDLFHPHHLLYSAAIHLSYRALLPFCPGCEAVLAAQLHNILWSAAGAAAFFYLIRHLWSTAAAAAATLLLLSLRGFWELSTQTTMYAPSAALLTLIAALALTPREGRLSPGRALLLALLLALAVLYHQSNVLFVLPLAVVLAARGGREGLKAWALISLGAGALALLAYLLAFLGSGSPGSVGGFIRFCLAYTEEICLGGQCKASPNEWGSLVNLSPLGLAQLGSSLAWNFAALPDRWESAGRLAVAAALLALAGWHLLRLLGGAPQRAVRLFALLWLMVYVLFFFWWLPSYQHPFVVTLPPVLILALLALKDLAQKLGLGARAAPAAAALLILLALPLGARNFLARIYPLHASLGDSYQEASDLSALAPEGCLPLTSYRTWNHLRYYFGDLEAVQAKHPLSFFYAGETLPAEYRLLETSCLAAAVSFLEPDYVLEDYASVTINGYAEPTHWLAYISWLFALERDENGRVVSGREFSLLHLSEGGPYLVLQTARQPLDGLEELFLSLDRLLEGQAKPFEAWLSLYAGTGEADAALE